MLEPREFLAQPTSAFLSSGEEADESTGVCTWPWWAEKVPAKSSLRVLGKPYTPRMGGMCRGVHGAGDGHWFQNDEVIIKLMKERAGPGVWVVERLSTLGQGKVLGGPTWLGRRRVGVRAMGRWPFTEAGGCQGAEPGRVFRKRGHKSWWSDLLNHNLHVI